MLDEPIEKLFQFLRGQQYTRQQTLLLYQYLSSRGIECPIEEVEGPIKPPSDDEKKFADYFHQEECKDPRCPWEYEVLEYQEKAYEKGNHHKKWIAVARKNPGLGTRQPTVAPQDQTQPSGSTPVVYASWSKAVTYDPNGNPRPIDD